MFEKLRGSASTMYNSNRNQVTLYIFLNINILLRVTRIQVKFFKLLTQYKNIRKTQNSKLKQSYKLK